MAHVLDTPGRRQEQPRQCPLKRASGLDGAQGLDSADEGAALGYEVVVRFSDSRYLRVANACLVKASLNQGQDCLKVILAVDRIPGPFSFCIACGNNEVSSSR